MYHGCSNCRKYYYFYGSVKKRKKEEEEEEQQQEKEEQNKLTLKLRSLKEGTQALGKWQCLAGCWCL